MVIALGRAGRTFHHMWEASLVAFFLNLDASDLHTLRPSHAPRTN